MTRYWKILRKDISYDYQDGLNTNSTTKISNPNDYDGFQIVPTKYLPKFYFHGTKIREVELPHTSHEFKMIEDDYSGAWYANMIILGKEYSLSDPRTYQELKIPMISLVSAAKHGFTEIVKHHLRNKRANLWDEGDRAMKWASLGGHLETVRVLMRDHRIDPSHDNNVSLRWAACNGHLSVVQLLTTDSRVNPFDLNEQALGLAKKHEFLEVVQFLEQKQIMMN